MNKAVIAEEHRTIYLFGQVWVHERDKIFKPVVIAAVSRFSRRRSTGSFQIVVALR